jgi:hypothetical protein
MSEEVVVAYFLSTVVLEGLRKITLFLRNTQSFSCNLNWRPPKYVARQLITCCKICSGSPVLLVRFVTTGILKIVL